MGPDASARILPQNAMVPDVDGRPLPGHSGKQTQRIAIARTLIADAGVRLGAVESGTTGGAG